MEKSEFIQMVRECITEVKETKPVVMKEAQNPFDRWKPNYDDPYGAVSKRYSERYNWNIDLPRAKDNLQTEGYKEYLDAMDRCDKVNEIFTKKYENNLDHGNFRHQLHRNYGYIPFVSMFDPIKDALWFNWRTKQGFPNVIYSLIREISDVLERNGFGMEVFKRKPIREVISDAAGKELKNLEDFAKADTMEVATGVGSRPAVLKEVLGCVQTIDYVGINPLEPENKDNVYLHTWQKHADDPEWNPDEEYEKYVESLKHPQKLGDNDIYFVMIFGVGRDIRMVNNPGEFTAFALQLWALPKFMLVDKEASRWVKTNPWRSTKHHYMEKKEFGIDIERYAKQNGR
jgi:hypothetical protein